MAIDVKRQVAGLTDARPANEAPAVTPERTRLVAESLDAWFGSIHAVHGVSLPVREGSVVAIIGPSGCGKSTFLRCLNRMHETVPTGRVSGRVLLDGRDIYGRDVNPIAVRKHIGMVFQRPTPFPTMSIRDNVAAGLRVMDGHICRRATDEIVERALQRAALWDEVKDRLGASALALSGGQQQRLCIARAIAVEPDVVLMDEPASALDPVATQAIEQLMHDLKREYTFVIVTHNMQQAARVADMTAFFSISKGGEGERWGELVEYTTTETIFTNPSDKRTEDYVTGRFG